MSIYTMRNKLGHYFKWVLLLVIVPIFVLGAFYSFGPGTGNPSGNGASREEDSQSIAVVNGISVVRGEFNARYDEEAYKYQQYGVTSPFMFADLRGGLLNQIIQQKLWIKAAEKAGTQVSDEAVDTEINKAVTQYMNADRDSLIGKAGKGVTRPDPRKDQAYAEMLRSLDTPMTVIQREEFFKAKFAPEQVRAQLSVQALMDKIKADAAATVTDADVTNSYNVYKTTLIVLSSGPKEQLKAKAEKIQKEAAGGADFKALAKANDESGLKTKGSQFEYSFETSMGLPQNVRSAIEALQPGQVTPVLDMQGSYAIFKLDSKVSKLPAKADPKATAERKKSIVDARQTAAVSDFQSKLSAAQQVTVTDPELRAYWYLSEANRFMATDPAKYKQSRDIAVKSLTDALAKDPNNMFAAAKLATLYDEDGKYKDAAALLMNGKMSESGDARKMLGDLQFKLGDKKAALVNYDFAMRVSKNNPTVLQGLVGAYQQIGDKQKSAEAAAKMADYQKRMSQPMDVQPKTAPASKPAAKPESKPAPKPGN